MRGLAYPGALQVLEEKGIMKNIKNVAGTSGGAITALMISLGYDSHEIDSILYSVKIKQFKDGRNIFGIVGRVKNEYGVFKGQKFENWLDHLIKNKTGDGNITFSQLHQLQAENGNFRDFYCTGTNITQQRLEIFSWEQTPQMKIKTAVHVSGCIPLYFKPVAIDSNWQEVSIKKNKNSYDIYVDGGMLCNYPINMFDSCFGGGNPLTCEDVKYNYQTLGLKLERQEQIDQFNNNHTEIAKYPIRSFNDFISALYNLMMEKLNRQKTDLKNEAGRTIYISHGEVSGKLKKISPKVRKQLYDNGFSAAIKFFDKF
jgi:NTE family protein